jgi:serine/threonine-protein kinase
MNPPAPDTPDEPDELPEGHLLGGRYRVVRRLGAGGMGAVYEAENTWTTRRVAVKVLRARFARDGDIVLRFRQEAVAATRLAHPNIVEVLDMDEDEETDTLFLVQELLRGRTLQARLTESGRLTPSAALDLLVPVLCALVTAHARGVVHRDLKPENIFLADNPRGGVTPTLIDFGVAKFLDDPGALRATRTGAVMGTPYYMSPEQVRGDKGLDGRTDVWSMGAVLYEALAGKVPFEASNYNTLTFRILSERAPRIERHAPDLAPALADIVHRALEPDLDRRFASMRAFLDALLACPYLPGGLVDNALRERHRDVLSSLEPAPTAPPEGPPPTLSRSLGGPARAALMLGVALVLCVVALALTVGFTPGAPPPSTRRPPRHETAATVSPPVREPSALDVPPATRADVPVVTAPAPDAHSRGPRGAHKIHREAPRPAPNTPSPAPSGSDLLIPVAEGAR